MDVAVGLPNAVPGTSGGQLVEWARRAEASGIELAGRGRKLDEMLEKIKGVWSGDEIGPTIGGMPGLIVGGHADASFARAARFADGWIAAGSGPDQFADGVGKARAAWSDAGREGTPRTVALAYFSLGDRAEEEARAYLTDYYAWLGEEIAEMLVTSAAKDPDEIKQYVATYEAAGCDELILFPSSGDPDQVDLLANAVGL